jgi:hypothetical protein
MRSSPRLQFYPRCNLCALRGEELKTPRYFSQVKPKTTAGYMI